ncbi:TVP38/TMEM64 family protein [Candidatus Entotheonella palauensis]|uniref:TVP38/TMEM64 family membrane protein n=1 Tax=Candidatus Entotheonella gemina TaxID=1429439 RepID=W4M413_9BACT|nr:VTT domain-containing protein [Candidatus Entotheonella palauensis]ETX04696.1 MAG: hypothetical protein ETSY2_27370 [Candidatus Entotheonella gemina]
MKLRSHTALAPPEAPQTSTINPGSSSPLLRMLLLAALLILCAAIVYLSPLRQWLNPDSLDTLKLWIASMGAWGPLIFTLLTAAVVAAGAPRIWMAALGGFAFGWFAGAALALVGTLGGCWVAFTYARWLGREWVQARVGKRLTKLNDLLQRHGIVMTLVLRSAPIGNSHVSNLMLALSPISRGSFMIGTALGVLPATVIYALFGSAASGSTIGRLTTAALLLVTLSGIYYLLASRSTLMRDTLTVLSNKK